MKIKFIVSEVANKYCFISNLAAWNIHCRLDYNKEFLKNFRSLTNQEKKVLKNFQLIFKNYNHKGQGKTIRKLEGLFFNTHNNVNWQVVKKIAGRNNYQKIRKTFEILEPFWQKNWDKYKNTLFLNQQRLKKLTDCKKINKILKQLYNFFDPIKLPKVLGVYLIIKPTKDKGNAGKSITKNKIIAELNILKDKIDIKKTSALIIHESIHSIFQNNNQFRNKISKFIKDKKFHSPFTKKFRPYWVFKELTTDIFAPVGYIAKKYYGLDIEKKAAKTRKKLLKKFGENTINSTTFQILRNKVSVGMLNLTKNYIENKKRLDNYFLQKIFDLIENK